MHFELGSNMDDNTLWKFFNYESITAIYCELQIIFITWIATYGQEHTYANIELYFQERAYFVCIPFSVFDYGNEK